ncbi:MAG: branched-chain amino acid ABC transporter permease [Dehalococcoidia bacterium]|nr:branched-chain amino acid ABC transporter permease [Dehalococcoidia bacterium]
MDVALAMQVLFGGLTTGGIYAMIALGFTLVYRSTTVLNFAHGEFAMMGAFLTITGVTALKLPVLAAFLLAVAVTAVVGVLFERLAVRPVRTQAPFVVILLTLGASTLFRGVAMIIWGKDPLTLAPFSGSTSIFVAGAAIQPQVLWVLGGAIGTVIGLSLFLNKTTYGKALRACSENANAASLVGINVSTMVLISFAISAGIGALAGVLITPITAMEFNGGFALAMKGLTGAIIGGLDRVSGVIFGALALGIIEAFSSVYISSLMKEAVAFVVLILVLMVWPNGVLARKASR